MPGATCSAAFGANIRHRREHFGLSLPKLAQMAGVAKGFLWQIENGTGNPTLRTVEKLAAAFMVQPCDLVREIPPNDQAEKRRTTDDANH